MLQIAIAYVIAANHYYVWWKNQKNKNVSLLSPLALALAVALAWNNVTCISPDHGWTLLAYLLTT